MNKSLSDYDIINQFINYYYYSINNKEFINLDNIIRDYTEFNYNDIKIKGKNIINFFTKNNIEYEIINYKFTDFTNRRTNIIVFGNITSNSIKKKFVDSIVFNQGKKNVFWIQSSILTILSDS